MVIHDSGGFEAGEGENLRAVKEFIEWRGRQSKLSEQLHCIWYGFYIFPFLLLTTAAAATPGKLTLWGGGGTKVLHIPRRRPSDPGRRRRLLQVL